MLSLVLVFVAALAGVFVWSSYVSSKHNELIKQHEESAKFYRDKAAVSEKMAEEKAKEAMHWKRIASGTSANVLNTQRYSESKPVTIKAGSVATPEDIESIHALFVANAAKVDHIKIIENLVYAQDGQILALESTVKNLKAERTHLELIIEEERTINRTTKVKYGSGGIALGIVIGILLL